MPLFNPPPPPKSKLGHYRLLSQNAGVHVSSLVLGAMSIGDKWSKNLGDMDKESSFKLLDAYYDNGGNFIDTSGNYQDETSEMFIGEWAEQRGIRDQLFVATKASHCRYSSPYKLNDPSVAQQVFYGGNSAKSLHLSVAASLKKLRTSYIDLLYVHWWDWETSVEEVMRALNVLIQQGKVLYLGISDTPAWITSKANQYARDHGLVPFSVYQGQWNVMKRSFERDIIPMARAEGMALAPWGVAGGGRFMTDEEEERRRTTGEEGRKIQSDSWERSEDEKKISSALEKVAKEVGVENITSVAIAYVMHKTPYVFPIVGGRKVEQLMQNIKALSIRLSDEQIRYLEGALPFDVGFPSSLIGDGSDLSFWKKLSGHIDKQPLPRPILPQ
ncbi:aryl-alcohol dehydrogenase [Macrolepiota fuliginosa MF-IS2]|uniref:Aryl-alcohol dehydrogenase n=1 Tax=Macrolepiota fuliginosa MF-IS2 TaxID=1400762 RepID=A0A9P5X8K2_9AGAR|nr:aryl-alcohol dehydrogenase [Macrolepiota fuliginosa MF-IS2]